jgi:hypothetical protein
MDTQELLQEITRRIDDSAKGTREYVETSAQEVRADFAAAVTENTRGYEAVAERMDDSIAVIAEGHLMLAEKIDRVAAELRQEMKEQGELLRTEMRAGDAALREELGAFRTEVRGEFAEVRRVARLESTVGDLTSRVGRLEERAAT